MTNAEARFNKSLRPRKPEGSLGRTAQDVLLDSHAAPELCVDPIDGFPFITRPCSEDRRSLSLFTLRLSFLFKKVVVCADIVLWLCPSLSTETLNWFSSLPILKQVSFWWWQWSDRYIISLFPPPPYPLPPPPPFSQSLISLWQLCPSQWMKH